ncbi:MAG: hypothetical protein H0W84_06255 [Bacteroidetes bacterium]|nr:hypothetical protein [Bacteroidota bacterium]
MYCSHSCRQFAYVLRKSTKGSAKELTLEKVIPLHDDANEESANQDIGQISDQSKPQQSIETNFHLNNLSVRTEEKLPVKTETELSVRTDTQKTTHPIVTEIKSVASENDYTDHPSKYLMQLDRLHAERDVWHSLSKFFDSNDEAGLWVSERYRCLIDVLLTFTEMKRIELDDLKEVCNAFTDVVNSDYYRCLHPSYPYIDEIKKLREQIKNTCIKTMGEHFKYRISKEKKQNLIVTRFELSQFVVKSKFSELKFREK